MLIVYFMLIVLSVLFSVFNILGVSDILDNLRLLRMTFQSDKESALPGQGCQYEITASRFAHCRFDNSPLPSPSWSASKQRNDQWHFHRAFSFQILYFTAAQQQQTQGTLTKNGKPTGQYTFKLSE